MTPQDITIAVTVYDRRGYIEQAVASALAQTLPVRVLVVEDCGPDAGLQPFVLARFGSRIAYHRNSRRRGLFDNWNACLELCSTPWLCLLHDDDFLEPGFVQSMVELAAKLPSKGLYCGKCRIVSSGGEVLGEPVPTGGPECWPVDVRQAALVNPVSFPGELFRVDYARALGGFRRTSLFTADWDMWVRLALHHGAAGTQQVVGNIRYHSGESRGTVRVGRSGKVSAFSIAQAKRNAALLRRQGVETSFQRAAFLALNPMTVNSLLENGAGYGDRMLSYNIGLLLHSPSPTIRASVFQALARWLGTSFVRAASRAYLWFRRSSRRPPA